MQSKFNKSVVVPVGVYAIRRGPDSKYVFADLGLAQELLEYQEPDLELKLRNKPEQTKRRC
jgi:lipoprotein-releasing system permease protein